MAWAVLIASGFMEAVWATALSKINGPTDLVPIILFFGGMTLSMAGLFYALKTIPVGTGYAVWVGIGAAATVTYSMMTGAESVSLIKIVFIVGLVACIMGLKFVESKSFS